jgi:hypothetical protein
VSAFLALLVLLAALAMPVSRTIAQPRPPAVYIDKGACPFECCTYREWRTEQSTVAYARPDKRSSRIGRFKAGTAVVALTGEVRSTPGRFTVRKPHGQYKPGDVLWVYTPLGEGAYKVGSKAECSWRNFST